MPDECFIIAPISTPSWLVDQYGGDVDHFRHVIDHLLVPAVELAGYAARPPIAEGADLIHAEIVRHLETSALVLCDLSSLNPNVFFELGIRTAVDRPVALVRDSHTDLPFDTTVLNTHRYEPSLAPWVLKAEVESLAQHISTCASKSAGRNTLWRHFGLSSRASMADVDASTTDQKIDFLLGEVAALARVMTPPARQGDAMAHLTSVVLSAARSDGVTTGDVLRAMGGLTEPEQRLVALRFGLDGAGLRTLEEVGRELGISRERARQVEARAIRALAEDLREDGPGLTPPG